MRNRRSLTPQRYSSTLFTTRHQSAQGMVEFALVLPLLLMLMLGVIDFGRLLFIYSAVVTSAREAARYGSAVGVESGSVARYRDCTAIRASAERLGSLAGIQAADILIQYDKGPGSPTPFASCPVGGTGPASVELKDRIVITVTAHFEPMVPLVNLPAMNIQSVSSRTILTNVEIK